MFSLFASRRWQDLQEYIDEESRRRAYVDSVYSTDNIDEFILKYNNLKYIERDPHRASSLFPTYAFIFNGDNNKIDNVLDMSELLEKEKP